MRWDAKEFPPCPLLLVASSDGYIRLYSMGKESMTGSPVMKARAAQPIDKAFGADAAKDAVAPALEVRSSCAVY